MESARWDGSRLPNDADAHGDRGSCNALLPAAYDESVILVRSTPALLGLLTVTVVLAGTDPLARAQEPAPAQLNAPEFVGDSFVELSFAWRFHPGDDAGSADPAFDDSAWQPIDPKLPEGTLRLETGAGLGWFRRHVRVAEDLWGKPLLARIESAGAAEVFLDGRLLLLSGSPVLGTLPPAPAVSEATRSFSFAPQESHLLAIRYRWPAEAVKMSGTTGRGFSLVLEDRGISSRILATKADRDRFNLWLRSVFTAVPIFLCLLHLSLFLLLQKPRENLFYGLWMLSFAWVVITDLGRSGQVSEAWRAVAERTSVFGLAGVVLFLLLTYYAVRTRPSPPTATAFSVLAALQAAGSALKPGHAWAWVWHVYLMLATADVVRIEVTRRTVRRDGGTVLLGAMAIPWVVILLVSFNQIGGLPELFGQSIYFLVVLPFAVAMSFCLVRDFARTNTQLEQRLAEVQRLSAQVLAQEREKHEYELRQRLLEAENSRKSRELEDARSLQLSMLPASLPRVPGLDVAAAMTTATEVGGDYYDFRTLPDGSLLVAIGDATGHGAAAAIVVTAVRSLFSALDGELELPSFLARCSDLLRGMHTGSVHMCLALARLRSVGAALCSAGMPPPLVHRAASDTVEEVVLSGLPLGSRLTGAYEERFVPLAPGDTLLLTTDGLAELPDPAGRPLGFDGAVAALRDAAGATPEVLVERVMGAAALWRDNGDQTDDITVVAVRVCAPEGTGARG